MAFDFKKGGLGALSSLKPAGAPTGPSAPGKGGLAAVGDKLKQRRAAGAGGLGFGRKPARVSSREG
jgi:hypothetical protein